MGRGLWIKRKDFKDQMSYLIALEAAKRYQEKKELNKFLDKNLHKTIFCGENEEGWLI